MTDYIIKPVRDRDFYVHWSGTVDGPLAWGSADETGANSERLVRADQRGTSSYISSGDWGTRYLYYRPKEAFIRRDLIEEWVGLFDEESNDTPYSDALLEKFDDNDPRNMRLEVEDDDDYDDEDINWDDESRAIFDAIYKDGFKIEYRVTRQRSNLTSRATSVRRIANSKKNRLK